MSDGVASRQRSTSPTRSARPHPSAEHTPQGSLTPFGISNPIAKPLLQLVSNNVTLQSVGAWSTASNAAQISAAFTATGAFALPPANEDSALLASVPPGSYTALVTAAPGTPMGVCLLEAYEAP